MRRAGKTDWLAAVPRQDRQPRSEGLMKILENPENAGMMNRAELELHKDQKKVDLYPRRRN